MEISLNARITCEGEQVGKATHLVINPVSEKLTHLVVEDREFPHLNRLVPVEKIRETNAEEIFLSCTLTEYQGFPPFIETAFIRSDGSTYSAPFDEAAELPLMVWPFSETPQEIMAIRLEGIAPWELAIQRGTKVEAIDGTLGKVDEFLIDSRDDSLTHLVIRESSLLDNQELIVPVAEIDLIQEETIRLKLTKAAVQALPTPLISRKW